MPYRTLDPEKLVATAEKLCARIAERFPDRGLSRVADEVLAVAREDAERARAVARPLYLLRVLVGLLLAAGLGGLAYGIWSWRRAPSIETEAFHAFQGVEAVINVLILTGAGVWFLLNLEARTKRRRILEDLHELRALAHVVDMHQLTKDPLTMSGRIAPTASSPERDMTAFELGRYLDYCSEILSIIAKLAALYMGNSRDAMVIDTANEIEGLTSSLSRKIWQKIMILQTEASGPSGMPAHATDAATGEDVVNKNCSPLHPFAL